MPLKFIQSPLISKDTMAPTKLNSIVYTSKKQRHQRGLQLNLTPDQVSSIAMVGMNWGKRSDYFRRLLRVQTGWGGGWMSPTTSSPFVHSSLSPSTTLLLFHSRLKNLPLSQIFSTIDSTDFITGPFLLNISVFGRPFVKRFALCYRSVVCLTVLSVCLSCL